VNDHPGEATGPAGERRDPAEVFAEHRQILLGVAYRIVGQVADAEDVVQEAWLRWSATDVDVVRDPRAFLVRATTRLAIDRLRRRKARREAYVGEWLSEPIPTPDQAWDNAALAESISMAMLVVLETLTPLERAVFVLREVFGFSHAEIAEALDRSEPAIRQLAKRAREHVQARRPRFEADPAARREVTERFRSAAASGDIEGLMRVLAPGVELVADGGGLVRAPLLPVTGADKVVRFLLAAGGRMTPDQTVDLQELNGGPAIVVRDGGSAIVAVLLDVAGGLVERIYLVGNPEKLTSLGRAPR
jgi:RNA polymerase sigma-70 factor (ECF subfamily)